MRSRVFFPQPTVSHVCVSLNRTASPIRCCCCATRRPYLYAWRAVTTCNSSGYEPRSRGSVLKQALESPKLIANVAADAALECAVEKSRQSFPLELADLGEADTGIGRLEPVLDVEGGGLVLFSEPQASRRRELYVFDGHLHRRLKGHRLVGHGPSVRPRCLDRL